MAVQACACAWAPTGSRPPTRPPYSPHCLQVRIAEKGAGSCEAWYFDLFKCIDKCTAPKLFAKLK